MEISFSISKITDSTVFYTPIINGEEKQMQSVNFADFEEREFVDLEVYDLIKAMIFQRISILRPSLPLVKGEVDIAEIKSDFNEKPVTLFTKKDGWVE